MFNNDNQVAVVLNYSDLCEICDFYDVSPGEISDNPCYARYIADHHSDLQNLISGYVEMDEINRDICNDFCYACATRI